MVHRDPGPGRFQSGRCKLDAIGTKVFRLRACEGRRSRADLHGDPKDARGRLAAWRVHLGQLLSPS